MTHTLPNDRILSLDAFRGLTIALMILVNDPGSWSYIYAPLRHAEWNGATLTDLVFPFFLFAVGVSIAVSLSKTMTEGADTADVRRKILLRSLKIFALGMLLGLLPLFDLSAIRLPGVLQRIALVYLACAPLFIQQDKKLEIWVFIALLVGYWLAMIMVPVPTYGAGDLEPGHNLANWIDSVLVPGKLWRGTWDPEGLFSTLPAIASGISGMLVGRYLLSDIPRRKQFIWLFWAGVIALELGAIWGVFFPLNKNIWTSSYVLYTSGWAMVALALLIYLMDVKHVRKPFNFAIIFGSNAIVIYALSYVLMFTLDHGLGVTPASFNGLINMGFEPELASLIWAVFFTGLCFIPAYLMHRRNIFIKL